MSGGSTDLLAALIQKCKCSVDITINQHKDYRETVGDHMRSKVEASECDIEDFEHVFAEMIEKDTIIHIHFYPNTSVGFYSVYHHDLIEALLAANQIVDDQKELCPDKDE